MREIKFRAWDEGLEEMIYFDLLSTDRLDFQLMTEYLEGSFVMQYTGLKDKNGKEIYERDILEITEKSVYVYPGIYQVVYGAGGFDIEMKSFGESITHRLGEIPNGYNEVIGNIHENPELLKIK